MPISWIQTVVLLLMLICCLCFWFLIFYLGPSYDASILLGDLLIYVMDVCSG